MYNYTYLNLDIFIFIVNINVYYYLSYVMTYLISFVKFVIFVLIFNYRESLLL